MLMIQVFPFASNSISTINNIVNEDLELLKTWVEEKKLSLNVAKIHCILIGTMSAKSSWNACTVLRIFYPRPVSEAVTRV